MPRDKLGPPNTADTTAKTTVKVTIEQRFMFHPLAREQVRAHSLDAIILRQFDANLNEKLLAGGRT
jgi:hypothetical protein